MAWLGAIQGASIATLALVVGGALVMSWFQAPMTIPVAAAAPILSAVVGAVIGYHLGKTKLGE